MCACVICGYVCACVFNIKFFAKHKISNINEHRVNMLQSLPNHCIINTQTKKQTLKRLKKGYLFICTPFCTAGTYLNIKPISGNKLLRLQVVSRQHGNHWIQTTTYKYM